MSVIRSSASAPGKVILFGEHAVVYGYTAVAACLSDLRIYVAINPRQDSLVKFDLPDMPNVKGGKGIFLEADLRNIWEIFAEIVRNEPSEPSAPSAPFMSALETFLESTPPKDRVALRPLLFLALRLLPPLSGTACPKQGFSVTVTSKVLPIGAGLGSSAAFSVAVAAALLSAFKYDSTSPNVCASCAKSVPTEAAGRVGRVPCSMHTAAVNEWAYASEVILHGHPSGLDNNTSTLGGALSFTRAVRPDATGASGRGSVDEPAPDNAGADASLRHLDTITPLDSFPPLRVLLTNTNVPRSTKQLVAGVRELRDSVPSVVAPTFEAIQAIADRCLEVVALHAASTTVRPIQTASDIGPAAPPQTPETEPETPKIKPKPVMETGAEFAGREVGRLIRVNHGLLLALGVGHVALQQVVEAAELNALPCKLTGAGGGGCAITLLPTSSTAASEAVRSMKAQLEPKGFTCFESTIGGVGVLLHDDHDNDAHDDKGAVIHGAGGEGAPAPATRGAGEAGVGEEGGGADAQQPPPPKRARSSGASGERGE